MDWDTFTVGAILAFVGGYIVRLFQQRLRVKKAGDEAEKLIRDAKEEARINTKEAEVQAREKRAARKDEQEAEFNETRKDLRNQQRRQDRHDESLTEREDVLNRKERTLEKQEELLLTKEENLTSKTKDVEQVLLDQREKLLQVSAMSEEDARKEILQRIDDEMVDEKASKIKKLHMEAEETAENTARDIVLSTIQRLGTTFVNESTVFAIDIPNDEMKGRIIGREGRNIRAFEKETGVDVVVDDTPGVVVISSFDPVKREVARITLEKLITDGRIHPARIEEMVRRNGTEVEKRIQETGKQVCYDFSIRKIKPKIVDLLGRLRYRTSYGQNCLTHTYETAYIAGNIAADLGLKKRLAMRCGLLHDIGKAVSHESEGSHPMVGADIARRCGESATVVNAIAAHHEDVAYETPYAVITQVADAISAARPGARRDSVDRYIKRLEQLEEIASSQAGVDSCFAVQAGREVRVIVDANKIDDARALILAREIAKQIEEGMDYLGEVKVTLIRETRMVEYAR